LSYSFLIGIFFGFIYLINTSVSFLLPAHVHSSSLLPPPHRFGGPWCSFGGGLILRSCSAPPSVGSAPIHQRGGPFHSFEGFSLYLALLLIGSASLIRIFGGLPGSFVSGLIILGSGGPLCSFGGLLLELALLMLIESASLRIFGSLLGSFGGLILGSCSSGRSLFGVLLRCLPLPAATLTPYLCKFSLPLCCCWRSSFGSCLRCFGARRLPPHCFVERCLFGGGARICIVCT
jgi:hypothetical protein